MPTPLPTNPATPEPYDEPRAVAADTTNVQQRAWGGEMDQKNYYRDLCEQVREQNRNR